MKQLLLIITLLFTTLFADTINFKQGWNFVGFNNNINFATDITLSDSKNVKLIWKYVNDPKLPETGWNVYSPSTELQTQIETSGFVFTNAVSSYEGSWVYARKDFSYTLPSANTTLVNNDIPVYSGWNLLSAINGASILSSSKLLKDRNAWVYRDNQWYLKTDTGLASSLYPQPTQINAYEAFWLNSAGSSNTTDGIDGTNGTDGKSAYQIWLDLGNTGTEQDFLESLKGTDGSDGTNGSDGQDGTSGTDGTDGTTSLVNYTFEPIGANCQASGSRVEVGLDLNKNNVLDLDEVTETSYLCNGINGNGTTGAAGFNSLIDFEYEVAGANCPNGGTKLISGLDKNNNNLIELEEITDTSYICYAQDMTSLMVTLANVTTEPVGLNCPAGGDKIDTGIDNNNDNILQDSEIDETVYSCNTYTEYTQLTDVLNATSTECLHGGFISHTGLDTNDNGTLESSERTKSTKQCQANAAPTMSLPSNNIIANENTVLNYVIELSDSDGDSLSISSSSKPDWMTLTIVGNKLYLGGTPTVNDLGLVNIDLTVTDTELDVSGSLTIDVQTPSDNAAQFTFTTLELGEWEFTKEIGFKFLKPVSFDRNLTIEVLPDSTAQEDEDYSFESKTLTVKAQESTATLLLNILDDSSYEGIETLAISALYENQVVAQTSVTINDKTGYVDLVNRPSDFNSYILIKYQDKLYIEDQYPRTTVFDFDSDSFIPTPYDTTLISTTDISVKKVGDYYYRLTPSSSVVYDAQMQQIAFGLPEGCVGTYKTLADPDSAKVYAFGCKTDYAYYPNKLYAYDLNSSTWELLTENGPNLSDPDDSSMTSYKYAYSYIKDNILYFFGVASIWQHYSSSEVVLFNLVDFTLTRQGRYSIPTIVIDSLYMTSLINNSSDDWIYASREPVQPYVDISLFNPMTLATKQYIFDHPKASGVSYSFANGKVYMMGGTNNSGTDYSVVSFILGDDIINQNAVDQTLVNSITTTDAGSSASYLNNIAQSGSQFNLTITNNSNQTVGWTKLEVFDADGHLFSTSTDATVLSDSELVTSESSTVVLTLINAREAPFRAVFYLEDSLSNNNPFTKTLSFGDSQ